MKDNLDKSKRAIYMSHLNTNSQEESPPGSQFYNELDREYDQMMDWESRLQREAPFFEKVIRDYHIESVLDIGCATGRHCFFFETLGVETIVGVDPSVGVLNIARSRAKVSGSEMRFHEASFTDVAEQVQGCYDLVCVLGNSISHVLKYDDLESAFANFAKKVSTDGTVLIHLLNWELRVAKQKRFFAPQWHNNSKSEKLFFRFFDFHEELVTMNLVTFQATESRDQKWKHRILQTVLRPWKRDIIRMAIRDVGLVIKHEFGGMDLSPYTANESSDYIVLAGKN